MTNFRYRIIAFWVVALSLTGCGGAQSGGTTLLQTPQSYQFSPQRLPASTQTTTLVSALPTPPPSAPKIDGTYKLIQFRTLNIPAQCGPSFGCADENFYFGDAYLNNDSPAKSVPIASGILQITSFKGSPPHYSPETFSLYGSWNDAIYTYGPGLNGQPRLYQILGTAAETFGYAGIATHWYATAAYSSETSDPLIGLMQDDAHIPCPVTSQSPGQRFCSTDLPAGPKYEFYTNRPQSFYYVTEDAAHACTVQSADGQTLYSCLHGGTVWQKVSATATQSDWNRLVPTPI